MDFESLVLLPRRGYILGIFGHFILLSLPHDLSRSCRSFRFIVGPIFYAANAGVFASVALASSWEPFQVAVAALVAAYGQTRLALLETLLVWSEFPSRQHDDSSHSKELTRTAVVKRKICNKP